MQDDAEMKDRLSGLISTGDRVGIEACLDALNSQETARVVSRLPLEDQVRLLEVLAPEDAAGLIEDIPDERAAELVEVMETERAAAILEELDSDHLVDVLAEMDDDASDAILQKMPQEDADEARRMLDYPPESAGGLMISEFLSYYENDTIQDVLDDLQKHQAAYAGYHVQYCYVVDSYKRLVGVLRVHDLLFPPRDTRLVDVMIRNPLCVGVLKTLRELQVFFEEHEFFGVPVVDNRHRLVGVLLPDRIEEAVEKMQTRTFLRLSGIIGGEEFRTMPVSVRSGRRLAWLSINIVLNIIAASVIAVYQDTVAAVITLAVFLPMVSDMSGCSGNQAVAVSMRELSLGLVRPTELLWVLVKELWVGMLNGVALGLVLGSLAYFWKGNIWLGLVVGGGLAANTLVSVLLGGILPLVLKRLKLDPALVSGPLLTTVTDMCGFFLILNFAAVVLPKLSGL